jgi:signal transduction histidine kinase/CheY-like chemotaxis protein
MTTQDSHPAIDYQRLFEATPAPHLVLDLDFHIVTANAAFFEVTMTDLDTIVGCNVLEVFPDNPARPDATGVANFKASLETVLQDQTPHSMGIQRYDLPVGDGTFEERVWRPVNTPIFNEHGQLHQILHQQIDMTRYVQARDQVEALARQAQRESRNKDQFLAMLGHELRNPMAAISTAVHVLKSAAPGDLAEKRLPWGLDIIDRQLEQLTRLVNDLLDVARINEGRIDLQREQRSVHEIVERAVETAQPLFDERDQTVAVNLGAESAPIHADITRMTQVVANLLNNAAKYTQTGGHIEVDSGVANDAVFIEVRDNGQGIDAGLLPHIFEMFKQADVSLDRSQGGLGLGLTLVKQLVEMHGGHVEAYSEGKDLGSTFIVELPRADRDVDILSRTATGDGRPPTSRRILVVDDNQDAADSLAMLLRVDGHILEVAHDGQAALELAQTFEPQVALLDIGLPVVDGYEVARRMRQMDQTKDTVLVAITGYGQASDRRLSTEAGFAYHLVKPLNHKRLRQVLSWINDKN